MKAGAVASCVMCKPITSGLVYSDQSSDCLKSTLVLAPNTLQLNRRPKVSSCNNSRLYNHVILPLLLVVPQLYTREIFQ